MKIAIDLSAIQGAHRMRGIGFTIINFINNISAQDRADHSFVFYMYPDAKSQSETLALLDLSNVEYEVRDLGNRRVVTKTLPGRLRYIISALNQLLELRDYYFGDSRVKSLKDIDVFLQADQSQKLPRKGKHLNVLFLYDMIPFVLEWDYLWAYDTARIRGFSRKAALRCKARRWLYIHKLRISTRRADKMIAISQQTKDDFTKYLSIRDDRIRVIPLGVAIPQHTDLPVRINRYIETPWGYSPRAMTGLPDNPYLLFVGGADRRRRIEDLVGAFNLLRAQGHELKLILSGDSMQGPRNIATEEIQHALATSSYQDDIIYTGFIDDNVRDRLYKNALVFIFPSKYEGFGLPVLEAMSYGCPIISYENSATKEVAGTVPIYAKDVLSLSAAINKIIDDKPLVDSLKNKGLTHVKRFSWKKTSSEIIDYLAN